MIEQTWLLWLVGAACASALMVAMWVIAVRITDASHADVARAYGTGALGVRYARLCTGLTGNRLLVGVLAVLWGGRLGTNQKMRRRWAPHENRAFLVLSAVIALGSPNGWIAIGVPVFLFLHVLLFQVTGIPETEAHAVRSRGDDYRRYQRAVSVLVPLPPRERAA